MEDLFWSVVVVLILWSCVAMATMDGKSKKVKPGQMISDRGNELLQWLLFFSVAVFLVWLFTSNNY